MVEAKPDQALDQKAPGQEEAEDGKVKVVVSHAEDKAELEVLVDRHATFWQVKTAIAKSLGRDEVIDEVQLVEMEHGAFIEYDDYDKLLDIRHLLALNVDFDFDVQAMQGLQPRASAAEQFANLVCCVTLIEAYHGFFEQTFF